MPSPLSPSTLVALADPGAQARSRSILTVVGGLETGRVLPLSVGLSVTLGRSPSCTFSFDEASVSGTHARIVILSGQCIIADEKSTNGTFVNDARVTDPIPLRDGDRVQLGPKTLLRFAVVDETQEQALKTMYEAAHRDGLTGVFNRKHLEERLDAELAFAVRHDGELTAIVFDIDHFKKVNDTYGHPAGDAVLKSTAATLWRALRAEDVLARYGGEEFVVLARHIRAQEGCVLADRLRELVSQARVSVVEKSVGVTVSAGVASIRCCGAKKDKVTLLGIADGRLYEAKHAGRNRVVGPK